MPRMPGDMAARYGELLAEYDASIKDLNKGKSETIDDLRAELKAAGFVGAEISAEIAMLKGALKVLGMTQVEQQKANDKDEGVSEYIVLLSLARARAHEAKAEGADPTTGEIKPVGNGASGAEEETQVANSRASSSANPSAMRNGVDSDPEGQGEAGAGTAGETPPTGTHSEPADGNTPTSAGHGGESATHAAALVVDPIARVDADAGVDRSGPGAPSLNKSAPVANDYSKPNPWCLDQEECGLSSWDHFCLRCQRVKAERDAVQAVQ